MDPRTDTDTCTHKNTPQKFVIGEIFSLSHFWIKERAKERAETLFNESIMRFSTEVDAFVIHFKCFLIPLIKLASKSFLKETAVARAPQRVGKDKLLKKSVVSTQHVTITTYTFIYVHI